MVNCSNSVADHSFVGSITWLDLEDDRSIVVGLKDAGHDLKYVCAASLRILSDEYYMHDRYHYWAIVR
jgi:hypothetical protein